MSDDRMMTDVLPVVQGDPVLRKLPDGIEVPLTNRVYPKDAPTLILVRNGAGWQSEDGMFNFPDSIQLMAYWINGVFEVPDPSPFEQAKDHFGSMPVLPYDVSAVNQIDWDHARNLIEEVMAGSLVWRD